ncbi:MAG: tetratricopeptide repeat protein [Selenomonadaceae bacterium]|nr:tetratricopeptide repeat protein [Selenomonadaceae bacterium]
MTLKNFPAAINDFNAAIKIHEFFFEARQLRAIAYYLLRKYKRAIEYFDKILAINVNDAVSYFYRGLSHHGL